MDKVNIKVCVRPYYHDVIDEVVRKPKFNKTANVHYITYKKYDYILYKMGEGWHIWVEEE